MAKIIPIREHFQHFLAEMKEFLGRANGQKRGKRGSSFSVAVGAAARPLLGLGTV